MFLLCITELIAGHQQSHITLSADRVLEYLLPARFVCLIPELIAKRPRGLPGCRFR